VKRFAAWTRHGDHATVDGMPTLPVPPGVHPDDGGDAAHRRLPAPTVVAPVAAGRDAAGLGAAVPGPAVPDPAVPWSLTIAVGLVVAVLAGAIGGLLVTGHRVPDGAAVLAVAALVLVPAVLVARAPRRAAASVAAVVGCAVLAVGLHPVLVALTAPPGTAARAGGHAAHHGAAAVEAPPAAPADAPAPPADRGATDTPAGPPPDPDAPRTWAESVAAVDLAALAAAGVDLVAVRDAGYDLAALADAGLDATTLAAAGADPADEHAPHHVAEAVAAAGQDPVAAVAGGTAGRAQDDAADRAGGTTRDRAGPDARATDDDARSPAVDPSTGRTLVLRIAAGSVTGALASVLLVRAGRASHRPGGDPGRAATS
jgi:hypothetical protein